MPKPKPKNEMVTLSVKIPIYQKAYLEAHEEASGNKKGDIIRLLIDYYIEVDPREAKN